MKKYEYEQLEHLIGKLNAETGGKAVCILNNHLQDDYHIRIFGNDGYPIKDGSGATIKDTIKNLSDKYIDQ
ncbi:MAG: hypothetical protein IIC76_13995 [Bacteroidetes bacterium]|nr:hypothetical protein [Bacteroidota bacterium]